MSRTTITSLKPHISLNVNNVGESVHFYRKLFGIDPMKFITGSEEGGRSSMGYAKFDVQDPPLNFVLNEVPFTKGGTLSHLGIQVATTEDVLKTRERWMESGLLTVDEMSVDCCYALQDKTWARDPDGNEWEVFVVLENTEPIDPELSSELCCTPEQKPNSIAETNHTCC